MVTNKDHEHQLEQVCSLDIHRVQSARLKGEGLPEKDELRMGIESQLEASEEKQKTRIISFTPGDPENPHNWSQARKWFITITGILAVTNSTFASSLPSGALPYIKADFGIENNSIAILTMSLFLLGYVVGPIGFAPLSEFYGRRTVSIVAFGWFLVGTICCAVSPNMPALLVFRFLAGIGASAPMSVTGGVFCDIWEDPDVRGKNMAIFSAVTMAGPSLAPVVSGFVASSHLGWRFVFWLNVIVIAVSFIPICFSPETFAPVLLIRKAVRLRSQGEHDVIAPAELEDRTLKTALGTNLSRPFRMFFREIIVLMISLYLSMIYGTFYLSFQSYSLIFQGIYGFGPGISGLPFIPVGFGALLSYFAIVLWDNHLKRKTARGETFNSEYRRLPPSCIAGPIYVASLFIQGWTARADVHWIVPALTGVPFGFGFSILFICFLNYLTDFYQIYAASALAACSMCRSLFGAGFPLFAVQMYTGMGIGWATSLLGFLTAFMCLFPFMFIKFGDSIRDSSKFFQFLQERNAMFEDEVDVDDDKTIQISGDSSETLSEAGSRLQKKIQVKELE